FWSGSVPLPPPLRLMARLLSRISEPAAATLWTSANVCLTIFSRFEQGSTHEFRSPDGFIGSRGHSRPGGGAGGGGRRLHDPDGPSDGGVPGRRWSGPGRPRAGTEDQ